MYFRSDNAATCPPAILDVLTRINNGHSGGYGGDDTSHIAKTLMRETLEAPEAEVFFIPSGTAANALALATLAPPYSGIYATDLAHINVDEGGAPEFYTGGAKLYEIESLEGKLTPEALRTKLSATGTNFPHNVPRGALSITNLTETGSTYTAGDIALLVDIAREFEIPTHLDGARFGNALVSCGDSPADQSWRAGVDVLVFGGTKLGAMGVEALVFFDPKHAREALIRIKRGGHLLSKGRFLSGQFIGLLENELWRDLATTANRQCAQLSNELKSNANVTIERHPDGNILFATWPRHLHRKLMEAGAEYYLEPGSQTTTGGDDEMLRARLVTSWDTQDADVARFLSYFLEAYF